MRSAGIFLGLLGIVSLLLRWLLSDDHSALRVNLYVPILLPLGLAIVGAFALPAGWRIRAAAMGLIALVAMPSLLREQPRLLAWRAAPVDTGDTLRLMTYNVMAYHGGMDEVAETIRSADPDVLCLVEGTFRGRRPEELARRLGDDYTWVVTERLSIASRLPVRESLAIEPRTGFLLQRAVIDLPSGPVTVYNLDMWTPIHREDPRDFGRLAQELGPEDGPAVLAGDFNVPRGSHQLARALDGWQDATASEAYAGFLGTWPMPLPLLQLDYIFVRGGVRPLRVDIPWSNASDHRPVVIDFVLEGDAAPSD